MSQIASRNVCRLNMTRFDLAGLVDILHLSIGVEIGVQYGYFSYYLLQHSKLALLWSVDSYEGRQSHYKDDARAHLDEFASRSRLLTMTSIEAARMAIDEGLTFDFVYIDAAHDTHSVQRDIETWFPLMKRPSVLAGHDYAVFRKVGVISAVNQFAEQASLPIYVTKEKFASWFVLLGTEWHSNMPLLAESR